MPKQVPTRFTEFEFTTDEWYAATRFAELHLMVFQTLIAQAAQKKVNLKLDLSEEGIDKEAAIILFAQREAELVGEINAYEHLLLLSQNTAEPEPQKPTPEAQSTALKPEGST